VFSQWDPFALIKTAFRSRDSGVKKPTLPSKGPPPLPKTTGASTPDLAARAPTVAWIPTPRPSNRDSTPVEHLFFQEGIDGHAESIPPSGRTPCALALEGTGSPVSAEQESTQAARTTIPPTSFDDGWLDAEEEVEDPARTRRRRAARIGTAWGTVLVLAAAGVAVVMSPRREVRSAAAPASPPPVETTTAHPLVAAPTLAIPAPPVVAPTPTASILTPAPASPASCRSGMLPLVAGRATCVDVAESFLCARDRRTHALRPAGCIDAKTPKAACESRGARLATSAERQQLAAAKGKTGAGAFRCAAAR
jgi:hypothetical protein